MMELGLLLASPLKFCHLLSQILLKWQHNLCLLLVNLLPPQPPLPPQMAQKLPEAPRVVLLKRPGQGRASKPVKLLCNHFRVSFTNLHDSFHYNVKISGEREGKDVINKIWCRKIMDKVKEVYGDTEVGGKDFAYDGEKSLFTVGPLRSNNIECTVVIDDERSSRRPIGNGSPSQIEQSKNRREDRGERFKVEITFAAKISMKALQAVIQGEVSDKAQDALRVLDIVLRQHASRKPFSGPNDGAGPSFSQSVEVLPPPPPNPPQMATQSVPSSSEPAEVLPPQPPLPPQMAQKLPEAPHVVLLKRPGQGRAGKPVKLLCNHFRVNFTNLQDSFHYDVKISGECEGKDVINKIWCRKIMDKVKEVYGDTELGGKDFAYDGEKSLFTVGPLRSNNIECTVVIDDERSSRRPIGNGSPSQIE